MVPGGREAELLLLLSLFCVWVRGAENVDGSSVYCDEQTRRYRGLYISADALRP